MAMATMEIDGRARVAIERECLETGRRIYLWMTFTIFVCLSLSSHLRVSYEKGKKSDTKNGGKNSEAKWRERKCCEAGRNIAQPSTVCWRVESGVERRLEVTTRRVTTYAVIDYGLAIELNGSAIRSAAKI